MGAKVLDVRNTNKWRVIDVLSSDSKGYTRSEKCDGLVFVEILNKSLDQGSIV